MLPCVFSAESFPGTTNHVACQQLGLEMLCQQKEMLFKKTSSVCGGESNPTVGDEGKERKRKGAPLVNAKQHLGYATV